MDKIQKALRVVQLRAETILDEANLLYTHGGRIKAQGRVNRLTEFLLSLEPTDYSRVLLLVHTNSRHPKNRDRYRTWQKVGQIQQPQRIIWAAVKA